MLRSQFADPYQELYLKRNFYSLCAVLQALRETGFDESRLSHLFVLINPDRNYAKYREVYEVAPGLPFLPPHIRHLNHNAEEGLSEINFFVSYKDSKNSVQAQSLGKRELSFDGKRLSWNDWAWVKKISGRPQGAVERRLDNKDCKDVKAEDRGRLLFYGISLIIVHKSD